MKAVCSFSYISRRGFRLRSKKLCDAAETPPAEAGEATEEEEEGNNNGEKDKQEMENKEEEKKNEGEGGQVDSDDCEVCPGTEAPPFLSPRCF